MSTASANFRERAYSVWKDIGERAAWTFVQTFIAVEGFDTFLGELISGRLDIAWFNSAKVAAAASLVSVVKGFVASRMPAPKGALVSTAALPEPVTVTERTHPVEKHGYELGSDDPAPDKLPPVRDPGGKVYRDNGVVDLRTVLIVLAIIVLVLVIVSFVDINVRG